MIQSTGPHDRPACLDPADREKSESLLIKAYNHAVAQLTHHHQSSSMLVLWKDPLLNRPEFRLLRIGLHTSLAQFYEHVDCNAVQAVRHLYLLGSLKNQVQAWLKLARYAFKHQLLREAQFAIARAIQTNITPSLDSLLIRLQAQILKSRQEASDIRVIFWPLKTSTDSKCGYHIITLQRGCWLVFLQTLYILTKASMPAVTQKYKILQELLQPHDSTSLFFRFQISGESSEHAHVSRIVNEFRLKYFSRRRRTKQQMKRCSKSGDFQKQPISITQFLDEKRVAALLPIFQELEQYFVGRTGLKEISLSEMLTQSTGVKKSKDPVEKVVQTPQQKGQMQEFSKVDFLQWISQKNQNKPIFMWVQLCLQKFLTHSKGKESANYTSDKPAPFVLLQDFQWGSFRLLVCKLFQKMSSLYKDLVCSFSQRLTLLELNIDHFIQRKAKLIKTKNNSKLTELVSHIQNIHSRLTHIHALQLDQDQTLFFRLRIRFLEGVMWSLPDFKRAEAQQAIAQMLQAKDELGLSQVYFFWLRMSIKDNIRQNINDRIQACSIKKKALQSPEMITQFFEEFKEKMAKSWEDAVDQYLAALFQYLKENLQLRELRTQLLSMSLEVLELRPLREDYRRFVNRVLTIFKPFSLMEHIQMSDKQTFLVLKLALLKYYSEEKDHIILPILVFLGKILAATGLPSSIIYFHNLTHRTPNLMKSTHRKQLILNSPEFKRQLLKLMSARQLGQEQMQSVVQCLYLPKNKKQNKTQLGLSQPIDAQLLITYWKNYRQQLLTDQTSKLSIAEQSLIMQSFNLVLVQNAFPLCKAFQLAVQFLLDAIKNNINPFPHISLCSQITNKYSCCGCYSAIPQYVIDLLFLTLRVQKKLVKEADEKLNDYAKQIILTSLVVLRPDNELYWNKLLEYFSERCYLAFKRRLIIIHKQPCRQITSLNFIIALINHRPFKFAQVNAVRLRILHLQLVQQSLLVNSRTSWLNRRMSLQENYMGVIKFGLNDQIQLLNLIRLQEEMRSEDFQIICKYFTKYYFNPELMLKTILQIRSRSELRAIVLTYKFVKTLLAFHLQKSVLYHWLLQLRLVVPDAFRRVPERVVFNGNRESSSKKELIMIFNQGNGGLFKSSCVQLDFENEEQLSVLLNTVFHNLQESLKQLIQRQINQKKKKYDLNLIYYTVKLQTKFLLDSPDEEHLRQLKEQLILTVLDKLQLHDDPSSYEELSSLHRIFKYFKLLKSRLSMDELKQFIKKLIKFQNYMKNQQVFVIKSMSLGVVDEMSLRLENQMTQMKQQQFLKEVYELQDKFFKGHKKQKYYKDLKANIQNLITMAGSILGAKDIEESKQKLQEKFKRRRKQEQEQQIPAGQQTLAGGQDCPIEIQ